MYSRLLDKHPIITKAVSSGLLFSLGDAITQFAIQKRKALDKKRNLKLFISGAVYFAPMLHMWYCKLLPRIQHQFMAGFSKQKNVFTSMALDQLAFAPVILTGFFMFLTTLDGEPEKGVQLVKSKIWETMKTNWLIWPAATTINFWFMPLKYQVLFANFIGLFWNIILSYITYK